MTQQKNQPYSDKHGQAVKMDESIAAQIRKRAKNGELPCAVAFDIAAVLGCEPAAVGQTSDLLNFRLVKCQLGLFGYRPAKKIVKPAEPAEPQLEAAVSGSAVGRKMACKDAWELAERFKVPKMTVCAVCEALGVKIKPCQLGAF